MVRLDERDRAIAAGEHGPAAASAMRIVTRLADAVDAPQLIDITSAHIDGCLYHGDAGLEFAEKLATEGGRVVVPTTLNVATLDRLHPELFRGDPVLAAKGGRLMDAYEQMGGRPTWTCAPYQLQQRPAFGEQIAWAESNAIVFANSVLGARTDRYGDFIDICAALTGRVPDAGLHRTENRRGTIVFRLRDVPSRLLESEVLYPVLGHLIGYRAGSAVPVIDGLPPGVDEDRLKALGAATASSGGVALFHAVGSTPEAATLDEALHGGDPDAVVEVDMAALRTARDDLSTTDAAELRSVSVGTPHFSAAEFAVMADAVAGTTVDAGIEAYINTGRGVLESVEASGHAAVVRDAGWRIVTDTCTYITPIVGGGGGAMMTNSAKWAFYAPGNLGTEVVFGSLEDCVASAIAGRVERDPMVWS